MSVISRNCLTCGTAFLSEAYQALYCSKICRSQTLNERRKSVLKEFSCICCGKTVLGKRRLYCSDVCKGQYKYQVGAVTTKSQYENISGNWKRYLSRLQYAAGRKRDNLTRDQLLDLLSKQNYKCAISGLDLTCQLEKGKRFWQNASVDRIDAGGPYTIDNVQLVCKAVNSWRSDLPLSTFIEVCRAVANNNQESLEVRDGRA